MIHIIIFTIANIITNIIGAALYKYKYPDSNKYAMFIVFFVGYFIMFYLITRQSLQL